MVTPPEVPPEDWHLLFAAVLARLREAADQDATGTVEECVSALEQLQDMLQRDRRQQS